LNPKADLFVFVGPPGSGKGSLSSLCTRELNWQQLSTGNLCRKHIAERTEIGQAIDFAIKTGKLVSDSLITGMVTQWFTQAHGLEGAIILDGYPRAVAQAQAFDEFLKNEFSSSQLHVVRLVISDELVIERLSNRLICLNKECQAVYSMRLGSLQQPKQAFVCDTCSGSLGKRADDEELAIRDRLKTYHKHEQDLLNFYVEKGQSLLELNVERPLNGVFDEFKKLIGFETV